MYKLAQFKLLCLLLLTVACHNNQKVEMTNEELVTLLADDVDFENYLRQQHEFKNILTQKLIDNPSKKDLLFEYSPQTLNKLVRLLDIPSEVLQNHLTIIDKQRLILRQRYPIMSQKKESERITILSSAAQNFDFRELYLFNQRVQDACDDAFNKAVARIHEEHDNGILICAAVTIFTGPVGLVACLAINETRTVMSVAQAIDDRTACKQQST